MRTLLGILFALAFGFVVAVGTGTAYAIYRLPQLEGLPARIAAQQKARGEPMVPLSQISPELPKALLATEDRTFYTNIGVSFEGIARSLIVDISSGQFVEGGSTITQQLVRDQLLTLQKTIPRKLEEMVLAIALTRIEPKREILDLYLNQVYFGNGAYGVAAAANIYFARSPQDLTAAQCTLLAGLPQAPSFYDPLSNPQAAKARQREVVRAMEQAGVLSAKAGTAILSASWQLR